MDYAMLMLAGFVCVWLITRYPAVIKNTLGQPTSFDGTGHDRVRCGPAGAAERSDEQYHGKCGDNGAHRLSIEISFS